MQRRERVWAPSASQTRTFQYGTFSQTDFQGKTAGTEERQRAAIHDVRGPGPLVLLRAQATSRGFSGREGRAGRTGVLPQAPPYGLSILLRVLPTQK